MLCSLLRPPCPDCGADDALALRTSYRHRPPLPFRWLALLFPAHLTRAYACAACHRLILVNIIRPRSLALLPPSRSVPARGRRPHRGHLPTPYRTSILGREF